MSEVLNDGAEMLFRQIHPSLMHNGEPASNRFVPSALDEGLLSVDRSSLTTAEGSHALYTSSGRESAAVFGLLVDELQSVQVVCRSDPTGPNPPHPANPAHALADYTALPIGSLKNLGKRLKRLALLHGQLYPSVEAPAEQEDGHTDEGVQAVEPQS